MEIDPWFAFVLGFLAARALDKFWDWLNKGSRGY